MRRQIFPLRNEIKMLYGNILSVVVTMIWCLSLYLRFTSVRDSHENKLYVLSFKLGYSFNWYGKEDT